MHNLFEHVSKGSPISIRVGVVYTNGFNSQGLLNEARKEHEYFLGRKSLKSQLPASEVSQKDATPTTFYLSSDFYHVIISLYRCGGHYLTKYTNGCIIGFDSVCQETINLRKGRLENYAVLQKIVGVGHGAHLSASRGRLLYK
jgi:hypothetical protein